MFAISFSVSSYHSNNVKLLGNYTNLENATGIPSLSEPLCLAYWKYFLNQKYVNKLYQLYTLIVSQNVTNGITAEVLNCVKENDVHSSFLHIQSSKTPSMRTHAILKF